MNALLEKYKWLTSDGYGINKAILIDVGNSIIKADRILDIFIDDEMNHWLTLETDAYKDDVAYRSIIRLDSVNSISAFIRPVETDGSSSH